MFKRYLTYGTILLLCILNWGCGKEAMPGENAAATEKAEREGIYVSITVSAGSIAGNGTKASVPTPGENGDGLQEGTAAENTVDDICIFLFQGDTNMTSGERKGINSAEDKEVTCIYISGNELVSNGATAYSVTREVSGSGIAAGQIYDVLVIANAGNLGNETEIKDENGSIRLHRLRDHVFAEAMNGNSHILMSSAGPETDSIEIKEENDNSNNPARVSIDLERMTARVDCRWEDSYSPENAPEDKVEILGAVIVNKYKGGVYAFKRVSDGLEPDEGTPLYLGDETENGGQATNYVIDPKTLSPETVTADSYDNYFPEWKNSTDLVSAGWKTLGTATSENNGVTYRFLDYTGENIVPASYTEESCENLCTGIVFRAKYTPAGSGTAAEDGTFYMYGGKAFPTLADTGISGADENNFREYGIRKYEGGVCYYTWWIKHAGDNDPYTSGPMEYAIVRNNIYQLDIQSIEDIGTETPEDYGLYLTCTVNEWISGDDMTIDFSDNFKGEITAVDVKEKTFDNIGYVIVAYSMDNQPREAQFNFTMENPVGMTWTAHLSNPADFEFAGSYYGTGGGGPVTLRIRPRRAFEEGEIRTTELYITTGVSNDPVDFNTEGTVFPGDGNSIRIRQTSTTEYDSTNSGTSQP